MNSDQTAQLVYLVLLGAAIGGSLMMQGRNNLGKMAQQMVIWALIFLGVLAGYGLWDQVGRTVMPQQSVIGPAGQIEVPRAGDGHYYVVLKISGVKVRFVIDTGATDLVLTARDARRVGIDPATLAYIGQASTANGIVKTARVWLKDVSLGNYTDPSVRADVNGGQMETSLLGMSYLQKFGKIEIAGDKMVLTR
jgi:aspartyl protease family protein